MVVIFCPFFFMFHVHLGFRYMNSKQHGNKMFKLALAGESTLIFEHKPLFKELESIEVEVPELKDWRLCKAAHPERCDPSKVKMHLFQNSAVVTNELQKAHVQKALLTVAREHGVSEEELAFTSHPNQVYALKKFKKGALKLYPCGTVSKAKDQCSSDKEYIKAFGVNWLVQPFKGLTDFKKDDGVLAAFWWVKPSSTETFNMIRSESTVDDCKIPFLMNTSPLTALELLTVEKTKEGPAAKKAKGSKQ